MGSGRRWEGLRANNDGVLPSLPGLPTTQSSVEHSDQGGAGDSQKLPVSEELSAICRRAGSSFNLDSDTFAAWLKEQGDPDWLYPDAVMAWARVIGRYGYPETSRD